MDIYFFIPLLIFLKIIFTDIHYMIFFYCWIIMYDYKEIISFINCNPGTNTKTLTFNWYCSATSGGCPDDGCQLWRHSWLLCQLWRNWLPVRRLMGVQTRICWLLHWTKSGRWWTEMGGHWFLKWRQNGTFQFSHSYFKLKQLRWSALWNFCMYNHNKCWNVLWFSIFRFIGRWWCLPLYKWFYWSSHCRQVFQHGY